MLLAVIYIAATAMSSLSILACDHNHLHHNAHGEVCHCCTTMEADTSLECGHHHITLGDHHTEFIVVGMRSDALYSDVTAQVIGNGFIAFVNNNITPLYQEVVPNYIGYKATPLRAAFISHESLRAPPFKA